MDAELRERVLECLRGLEIGESISADGIADEIGEKLSDVYDALEILEEARLVELHPAYRKGNDPTYTLTTKGKHHAPLKAMEEPEPVEEDRCDRCNPEVRPSADRMCRFCKKEMEPNKVRRHERFCIKNPDRDMPGKAPKHTMPEPVPAPAEYAEESNATHVLDYEVSLGGHVTPADESDFPAMPEAKMPFAPSPDRCSGCRNYDRVRGECKVKWINEESCNHAHRSIEPQLQDVPSVEDILGQQQAAEDPGMPDEIPPLDEVLRVVKCDALVLKGSPGMDALLRLLAHCQQAIGSGADIHLSASVMIVKGLDISVYLDSPARPEGGEQ